ncbi:MAG: hypothetical protein CM15mV37_0410 [uncultured marine virus]|nr:MAG: hypothetical protein CM15mV37_0410 [uncultured marine virus]
MEELLRIIQQDPELWELVEQLKHQDQEPMEFFTNVANMFAVEFEELHRTDLRDKLSALFGGFPKKAYIMVPYILHIALDMFLLKAIPDAESIRD